MHYSQEDQNCIDQSMWFFQWIIQKHLFRLIKISSVDLNQLFFQQPIDKFMQISNGFIGSYFDVLNWLVGLVLLEYASPTQVKTRLIYYYITANLG